MADFTPDEEAAMLAGGAAGAEYLSSIGQFALDKLTGDQALTFLKAQFGAYHLALADAETRRFTPHK